MIFRRAVPFFLSALVPLTAADFPVVPRSRRVLSEAEVKEFWIARLKAALPPPQAACTSDVDRGRDLIGEIRAGRHDVAARLVCLSHNAEAWIRQGNPAAAQEAERGLLRLREKLAARPQRNAGDGAELAGKAGV